MNTFTRLTLAAAALAVSPLWAAEAPPAAATVSGIEGTALVNQGEEFVTVADAQALQPGDQLMVMEGGKATLTFGDGCVVPVEAGSIVTVPAQSTCAGGVASTQRIGPQYAQAVGERRSRQGGTPGVENALTVATAVGLTFAAIIVAENSGNPNGDDDEPVSP